MEQPASFGVMAPSKASMSAAQVWVVEVNPHFETTDGCLYDWARDSALLQGQLGDAAPGAVAKGAPDFHISLKPSNGASSMMYGGWREIM